VPRVATDPIYSHAAYVHIPPCLHDLAHPAGALLAARQAPAPGGTVLVMDENVDETLVAPGAEVQRFFAAASVIWCTPQGRVEADSEVIGAVMRPARLRELAAAAGFGTVEFCRSSTVSGRSIASPGRSRRCVWFRSRAIGGSTCSASLPRDLPRSPAGKSGHGAVIRTMTVPCAGMVPAFKDVEATVVCPVHRSRTR
jgi:hypothetical protein